MLATSITFPLGTVRISKTLATSQVRIYKPVCNVKSQDIQNITHTFSSCKSQDIQNVSNVKSQDILNVSNVKSQVDQNVSNIKSQDIQNGVQPQKLGYPKHQQRHQLFIKEKLGYVQVTPRREETSSDAHTILFKLQSFRATQHPSSVTQVY